MKQIIYSAFFLIGLFIVGCTTWEDYSSESYGDGPAVDVVISSIRDSSFIVNVSPGSNAKYYAYWIVQSNTEIQDVSAQNILKTAYSTGTKKSMDVADAPSATVTFNALPYTVYQIYAVASSDKGVVGEITHQTVTTTDGVAPIVDDYGQSQSTPQTISVLFNKSVIRGAGAVSITYIKRYDLQNQETVVLDDEYIDISDDVVDFEVPDPVPGVYFTISWEAGAFTDVVGNKTPAFNSGLNASGQFFGISGRIPTAPFDVNNSNVVVESPFFSDWQNFEAELQFDFNIYPNTSATSGAVKMVYSTAEKQVIVNVAPSDWTVSGKSMKIKLPEAPQLMDSVRFILSGSVFYDVYGNPNGSFSPESSFWCYRNDFKKEDFIGTFQFSYGSAYEDPDEIFDGGSFTIEEDPDVENGVILKDFYLEGSEIQATYDITSGKLFVPDSEPIGIVEDDGEEYLLLTYNIEVDAPIEFLMQGDKSLVCASSMGIVALEISTEDMYWWDKLVNATMTPETAAGSAFLRHSKTLHNLLDSHITAKKK